MDKQHAIADEQQREEWEAAAQVMVPAVVEQTTSGLAIFDSSPAELRIALGRATENWNVFLEWIKANLVDGTPRCYPQKPPKSFEGGYNPDLHSVRPDADYARIYTKGGWSKPTLLKAGAEKIASKLLRVTVRWPTLSKVEDVILGGVDLKTIMLRCELVSGGVVVGEGGGAANVSDGDVNKAIKMAMKSSLIAAVLSVAGISSVFTQDMDDDVAGRGESPPVAHGAQSARSEPRGRGPATSPRPAYIDNPRAENVPPNKISDAQRKRLWAIWRDRLKVACPDITEDEAKRELAFIVKRVAGVEHSKDIETIHYDPVVRAAEQWTPGSSEPEAAPDDPNWGKE